MGQKIDMSPEAVTGRMIALDQLWELAVALKSSDLKKARPGESKSKTEDAPTVMNAETNSSDSAN